MDGSHAPADLRRRRFTVTDIQRMRDTRAIAGLNRFELLGGELVDTGCEPQSCHRRFTLAEMDALLEAGVLGDGERVELLGGEFFEMSPQGPLHWRYTQELVQWLSDNRPANTSVASNGPLRLSDAQAPEPEFFMYPRGMDVNNVRGPDIILVVEVAHSSLRLDRLVKAPIYADHGVGEYWIVDVENRRTLVHRRKPGGYGAPDAVPFDQPLQAPGGQSLTISQVVRLDG